MNVKVWLLVAIFNKICTYGKWPYYFCFSTTLVLFGPFYVLWSYAVHFGPIRSTRFYSLHFILFNQRWSYLIYLVHFSPLLCTYIIQKDRLALGIVWKNITLCCSKTRKCNICLSQPLLQTMTKIVSLNSLFWDEFRAYTEVYFTLLLFQSLIT